MCSLGGVVVVVGGTPTTVGPLADFWESIGFGDLSCFPSERAILARSSLYFFNRASGVDSFAKAQSLTSIHYA